MGQEYFNKLCGLPESYNETHVGFFNGPNAMAELNALGTNWQLGMTATVNGVRLRWTGVAWLPYASPSSLGKFNNFASLPYGASDGDIAWIPQLGDPARPGVA